jgi:hypothetical protein
MVIFLISGIVILLLKIFGCTPSAILNLQDKRVCAQEPAIEAVQVVQKVQNVQAVD